MAARPAILFALTFLSLFPPIPDACAQTGGGTPTVAINEICWMGSQNSASDEWIELYNNANYGISLSGWSLKAGDSLVIELTGRIPAKGFYLLERTDDNSASGAKASQIFKGSLNNSGLGIELYDEKGKSVDGVNCSGGWFEGDNAAKRTMERISPEENGSKAENWQASLLAGGTPGETNSPGPATESKEEKESLPAGKADLSSNLGNKKPSLAAEALAAGTALLGATAAVFLKRNLKNIK